MHAFLPAREGAAPASGDTRSPSPALSTAVPGASSARLRLAALPRPGGSTAPAARRSATRLGGDPPAAAGTAPRAPLPGARPPRAPHPGTRSAPPRAAQPRSPPSSPQPLSFFTPILTLSFQTCLPPPPPGAKPRRAYLGGAGGHAGLGGRCLPALRGSPEVLGSRSSPAAAALSDNGRGAGRAPSKPLLPNLRRCAGGGRRSRGSAAALNPFFCAAARGPCLYRRHPPVQRSLPSCRLCYGVSAPKSPLPSSFSMCH